MKTKYSICVLITSLVLFCFINTAWAEKEGWNFNGFSWGYSGHSEGLVTYVDLDMHIDCEFPEGRPRLYEPNPAYNPGYLTPYEGFYLITPEEIENITGNYYSNSIVFSFDTNFPPSGEYEFKVYNATKSLETLLIFSHKFDMDYNVIMNITNLKWLYNCGQNSYQYSSTIDESNINSICGFQLKFNIENIGDIPYYMGSPLSEELNIKFDVDLIKSGETNVIFSSGEKIVSRPSDLYYTATGEWKYKLYIAPDEKIECSEIVLFDNDAVLKNSGAGSYELIGNLLINYNNLSFGSSSEEILKITGGGIPGFEILVFIFAMLVVLILKRKI